MTNKPHFPTALDALLAIEQGFELVCAYTDDEMSEFGLSEKDRFFPFMDCDLQQPDTIEELLRVFKDWRKVYPTPETEHLLEPKEGDIALWEGRIGIIRSDVDPIKWRFYIIGDEFELGTRFGDTRHPVIIRRAGKPFPAVVRG